MNITKKGSLLGILFLTILMSSLFLVNIIPVNIPNSARNSSIVLYKNITIPNYTYQWYKTYDFEDEDIGNAIDVDSKGNIYVVGKTATTRYDGIEMGLDSSGNQIWNRTWGSGYDDANYDVIVYNYSRIYTIGEYDFDVVFGTNQLPIHCFNSSGSIIFSDTYISLSVHGYGMTIDTNLANPIIYIAGKSKVSNPSALLVAYYLNGTRKNSTKYNGPTDDIGYAVGVDSKNFIYVGGVTNSSGDGSWDVQILKYDTSFHLKWNITWGTPYDDTLNDLYIDKNDNIYVCGETDTGGGVISFLMMFNVTGSLQWIRLWSNYQIEVAKSITEDKDGNLVIAGYVLNNYNDYDVMITAFDKSGLQLWYDIWGSNGDDYGYGICADTNGSIFICGKTNSTGMGDADGDLLVLKFSNIQNTPPTTTTTSTSTIPGFNYFAVIISVGFIIVVVFGIKKFPSRRKFPVNL